MERLAVTGQGATPCRFDSQAALLSLPDVVDRALCNNPQTREAWEKMKAAAAKKKAEAEQLLAHDPLPAEQREVTAILLKVVDALVGLRVTDEDEAAGLDLSQHSETAYSGGAGYGAQFWVYGGMEGLPDVAYSPGGALGQYAMIIPAKNVVIVRRGLDRGEGFKLAKFSADLLKAMGL